MSHFLEFTNTLKEKAYFNFISQKLSFARFFSTSYIIFAFKKKQRLLGDALYSDYGFGTKIFNLKNKTVLTKIRSKNNAKNILEKIYNRNKTFSPKLKKIDYNNRFYIEKLIYGRKIRISEFSFLDKVFKSLCEVYKKKMDTITINYYLEDINKEFYRKSKFFKEYDTFLDEIERIIHDIKIHFGNRKIILAKVHGDLHLNNTIVKEDNTVTLLDWEASRRCSLLYDYFTFWSIAHFKGTIDIRRIMKKIPMSELESFAFRLLKNFKIFDKDIVNKIDFYFSIFIIERIMFHIGFINNQYLKKSLIREIERWIYLWKQCYNK